ncbi:nucleoside monophosphate kinase [Candidatus Kaiserbacteria bacterium]|nr:nucleoside monophosphate kinase [Candidatus Kaiserbacteria bacterium]
MEPLTVTFFGISGSGKGTQVALLENYLKENDSARPVVRAEMGAMLREFMKGDSELAKRTKSIVDAGGLLPSFMPVFMLARLLEPSFKGDEHLILDGTPRRPTQAEMVDENVRFYGRTNLQAVSFKLSKEEAKRRLAARGTGRADDTDEAMQVRFSWYEEHVVPSIDKLRELGWTVHEIDADLDVETIHKNILSALKLA